MTMLLSPLPDTHFATHVVVRDQAEARQCQHHRLVQAAEAATTGLLDKWPAVALHDVAILACAIPSS